ncbi:MAG: polyprenol monophosphomannose synthase [Candidatus Eisenbacteria bacterium]|nr:polyprenol monophosphomannose synthase [Candidatus Eisenbacteria bacterium]
MKITVVIPTYNEKENIRSLLSRILQLPHEINVLIVDDNSPDGTGEIGEELGKADGRIRVLHRERKMGLGSAYVAGFRQALNDGADVVMEMDADFSHDPSEISKLIGAMDDCDLVLGSRYIHGVTVVNWPLGRLILSYMANVYTRVITGLPVRDATGGFKAFRRKVLESIDLSRIHSDGYSFQIEMSYLAWRNGFKIKEIPITFVDRRVGISKMSKRIIWEAVWLVWRLRLQELFGRA